MLGGNLGSLLYGDVSVMLGLFCEVDRKHERRYKSSRNNFPEALRKRYMHCLMQLHMSKDMLKLSDNIRRLTSSRTIFCFS